MTKELNVYRVKPVTPVYGSPYYVVASNYGEAEQMVLAVENKGELDCQGINSIEWLCRHYPDDPTANQFIGF